MCVYVSWRECGPMWVRVWAGACVGVRVLTRVYECVCACVGA